MTSSDKTLPKEHDLPSSEVPPAEEEKVYVASQWQLIWWRFRRHKMAMASAMVIILLYVVALFCEFVAPYDPKEFYVRYKLAPPTEFTFAMLRVTGSGHSSMQSCRHEIQRRSEPYTRRTSQLGIRSSSSSVVGATRRGAC